MKAEPNAPAAPAVYLFREVHRDDKISTESVYQRVKVLTEEGRRYANVEIQYRPLAVTIGSISARTIHADGTVLPFNGEIFDKPLVRSQGERLMAKIFTLPQVEVGSIVEYHFTRSFRMGYVYDSRWLLSADLYTRFAKFTLNPYAGMSLRWDWSTGLPPGTAPPHDDKGIIRLEAHNIPAFANEDFIAPEQAIKYRVDFIYSRELKPERDPAKYWKRYGKDNNGSIDEFMNAPGAMRKALAEIVNPDDSPETKLRKLYARVQGFRNLTYEEDKSRQESERDRVEAIRTVESVWKLGYGSRRQLTWLFLALVRAGGFEAWPLKIATREKHFFHPKMMNAAWLDSEAVVVKLNGKDIYLDPGSSLSPFGMLVWSATYVPALRLDRDGGTWVQTPQADPSQSRVERSVTLTLAPDGTLEGKATIRYTGYEAQWRRSTAQDYDEEGRREYLVNDTKADLSATAEVRLTNSPDWKSTDKPLVAEFDLKVSRWATPVGQRLLLPVGLFGARAKHTFEHAHRVNPIYMAYPYQLADDVTIAVPEGWQVSGSPQPRSDNINVAQYRIDATHTERELKLKRELTMNIVLLNVEFYPVVREFYQFIRTSDEDQAVISRNTPANPG